MLDCLLLKCRIVHFRTVVGFVRNCSKNDTRNFVQICRMRDGRTFHFHTICAKSLSNPLLYFRFCDKLISTGDSPCKCMNIWICLFICLFPPLCQSFICRKCQDIHVWNLTDRIPKCGCIHIMLYRIFGNHNIANINGCI